jgi:RNA polymerase sigma factor FliA
VSVVALDELLSVGAWWTRWRTRAPRTPSPVRVAGAEAHPGRRDQPARRTGEDRHHPLLLRGPDAYEGLTLAEIGQVLGVTELRVCQMHTKAVLQLRAKMQDAR